MQEVQNVKINEAVSLKDDSQNKKYDFSKYSDLEGFYLDDELLAKFQPIAQELNLSQESVELLLDIAYQMSLKQDEKFKKDLDERQNSLIEEYDQMFKTEVGMTPAEYIDYVISLYSNGLNMVTNYKFEGDTLMIQNPETKEYIANPVTFTDDNTLVDSSDNSVYTRVS